MSFTFIACQIQDIELISDVTHLIISPSPCIQKQANKGMDKLSFMRTSQDQEVARKTSMDPEKELNLTLDHETPNKRASSSSPVDMKHNLLSTSSPKTSTTTHSASSLDSNSPVTSSPFPINQFTQVSQIKRC